jgi:hypothetical protein
MTHIAIQEALDGKAVEWMEKVSDEEYQASFSGRLNPINMVSQELIMSANLSQSRGRSSRLSSAPPISLASAAKKVSLESRSLLKASALTRCWNALVQKSQ